MGNSIVLNADIAIEPRSPLHSFPGQRLYHCSTLHIGGTEDGDLDTVLNRMSVCRKRRPRVRIVEEFFKDKSSRTICAINCKKLTFCYSTTENHDAATICDVAMNILLLTSHIQNRSLIGSFRNSDK